MAAPPQLTPFTSESAKLANAKSHQVQRERRKLGKYCRVKPRITKEQVLSLVKSVEERLSTLETRTAPKGGRPVTTGNRHDLPTASRNIAKNPLAGEPPTIARPQENAPSPTLGDPSPPPVGHPPA